MKTLRRQSALIIWILFSIYTKLDEIFGTVVLSRPHFISFILVVLAIIAQAFKEPNKYLITFYFMVFGLFAHASLIPETCRFGLTFGESSVMIDLSFLLLNIYFIAINRKDFPEWFSFMFKKDEEVSE